jgi:hypothetical protein
LRLAALIGVISLASLAGAAGRSASSAPVPVVPCDEDIGHPHSGHEAGYRVVLGVVSVPPAYLQQVVATHERPWAYWRKAGLSVWSTVAVTVSVPQAWRNRVAITWGNNTGNVNSLRIAACAEYFPAKGWDAYAGGFSLRSRSACVPVIFRVGRRSATVRFGIGRMCAAAS